MMSAYLVSDGITLNVVYASSIREATLVVAKKDKIPTCTEEELACTYEVTRLVPELVKYPKIVLETEMA